MRFLRNAFLLTLLLLILNCLSYADKPRSSSGLVQSDSARATVLKTKSPTGALFRSVAFPGWGQLYNRKYLKAGLVFGVETTFLVLMAIDWKRTNEHKELFDSLPEEHPDKYWEYEQYKFYKDRKNLYLWSILTTVFLSMFDAYVDAHLYNFDKEMERIGLEIHPQTGKKLGFKLSFNF
jgi:hypothetical protein